MLFFVLLAALGVGIVLQAVHRGRHARALTDAPRYSLPETPDAALGRLVALRGRAAPPPEAGPQAAPVSGRPCVWWGLRLRGRVSFPARRFPQFVERTSPIPFRLTNGGRGVLVAPEGLVSYGHPHQFEVTEAQPSRFSGGGPPPVAARVIDSVPGLADEPLWQGGRVTFTEWLLEEGAEVTVTGELITDPITGESVLQAWRPPGRRGHIFGLTPGQDHRRVDDLRRSHRLGLVVGILFTVVGLLCFSMGLYSVVTDGFRG